MAFKLGKYYITRNNPREILRENAKLINVINEVKEILLCYGETFDSKIHQEMQKKLLDKLAMKEDRK